MANIDPIRHLRLHLAWQGARWRSQDAYPSSVEWADEHEQWLSVVPESVFLRHYLPRLRDRARHRNKALAEIGVAFFLERRARLPIASWQPPGLGRKAGEFLAGRPPDLVFVEVKSPSWEAEVIDQDGKGSRRLLLPKHVDDETRWTAPWRYARSAIAKASLQVPGTRPTLVVLNDDLPLPLDFGDAFNARLALYGEGGCFRDGRYPHIGAVGIFQVELPAWGFERRFTLFRNQDAIPAVRLPPGVARRSRGWSASRRQVVGLPRRLIPLGLPDR